jgi:hypothetical protein
MALLAVSAGERVNLRAPVTFNSANDLEKRAGKVLRASGEGGD